MDKKVSLDIKNFNILDDYSDSQLAIVEIFVCHDGNNLHNLPIDLSVLKKAKKTLRNKFLVAGFDGEDFEGHEKDEQIVGFFPESSKMRFEEEDGKTFLVAEAIMSKIYANWAYEIFLEDNKRAVSMEISVLETEEKDDGLEHITSFVFNGVTILGKKHQPACEGSNASIIKFSKENALNFYSKHFKNSNDIKNKFVENMGLADFSGKEESVMNKEEKKVAEERDEKTYMEEEKEEKENKENKEEKDAKEEKEKFEEEDKEDKEEDKENEENEEEDDEKEDKNFESLTVEQKYEVFRDAIKDSINCGWLETFDEEFIYVYSYEECCTYRYSYTLEGTKATIDIDSKTRVMRGGYVEFSKYETELNKVESLEAENCKLKERISTFEEAEKDKAVESILSEVVDVLSTESISELREKSKDFSLDNISGFENEVKAIAFEKIKKENKKENFERMNINEITKPTGKYSW